MAEFLYLFRGGAPMGTPEQMQKTMERWGAWIKQLTDKGHFKAGQPLDTGGKVVANKAKTITDGPYAEAKDVVGGYLIVEAKDIDHAVVLSKECPIFEGDGTVEVRAIAKM